MLSKRKKQKLHVQKWLMGLDQKYPKFDSLKFIYGKMLDQLKIIDSKILTFNVFQKLFSIYNNSEYKNRFYTYNKTEKIWVLTINEIKKLSKHECQCEKKDDSLNDFINEKIKTFESYQMGIEFEKLITSFIGEYLNKVTPEKLQEILKSQIEKSVKEEMELIFPSIIEGIKEYIDDKYSTETEESLEEKIKNILSKLFTNFE